MFYQRLRDLREDKDLLQEDIAEIIQSSVRQYGLYERGKTDIPLEKTLKLANFYNVSIDYITGRTNDKKGFNKSDLPDTEVDLLKKFRSLSEKQQGIILGRIEAMTEENEEIQAQIKEVG